MSMENATSSRPARRKILSVSMKDRASLYAAYMPFVNNGGLFVQTKQPYKMGDSINIMLSLIEAAERLPIAGKIIWVTPAGAEGYRATGVGFQFDEKSDLAKKKIENLLAGILTSSRPTHTM